MARFGLKNKTHKVVRKQTHKKILHVVPGPSTMNRCSTLSKAEVANVGLFGLELIGYRCWPEPEQTPNIAVYTWKC